MTEPSVSVPDEATPTLLLRLRRYEFYITRRYYEGQTIGPTEAYALNQLLAENIRNNTLHWVTKAESESPEGILIPEQICEMQSRISAYASSYQFKINLNMRSQQQSPINLAIHELAHAQSTAEGHQNGYDPDSLEVKLRYRQLIADTNLHLRARALVYEREKVAQNTLNELLEGYSI